jgi:hypothetical protein
VLLALRIVFLCIKNYFQNQAAASSAGLQPTHHAYAMFASGFKSFFNLVINIWINSTKFGFIGYWWVNFFPVALSIWSTCNAAKDDLDDTELNFFKGGQWMPRPGDGVGAPRAPAGGVTARVAKSNPNPMYDL